MNFKNFNDDRFIIDAQVSLLNALIDGIQCVLFWRGEYKITTRGLDFSLSLDFPFRCLWKKYATLMIISEDSKVTQQNTEYTHPQVALEESKKSLRKYKDS